MKLFTFKVIVALTAICFYPFFANSQAVSGIITDYNSYWKSSISNLNATKPVNSHNLLAFTYNGTMYSTGVNNSLLASHGETFIAGDFWSLPIDNISGTINGNTKVGLGEMYDGVHNGASTPPPAYGISNYLTDGIKGLNLGTCIANLPQGSITFFINTINPASIGDGIPDILVTQIADPSGSSDNYEFTNQANTTVGNAMNIVFTNITPVGTWTADFYEASTNPLTLTAGFTNTDRPLRLWAADLSDFGITAANYQSIKKFKINLSGNSDVAFVAYNAQAINLTNILPVTLTSFKGAVVNKNAELSWETKSENNTVSFEIERSADAISFAAIGEVAAAGNSDAVLKYSFVDTHPLDGKSYYRLKIKDSNGKTSYSNNIVKIEINTQTSSLTIFPNPAKENVFINHPTNTGNATIKIYNTAGKIELTKAIVRGSAQTTLQISQLAKGLYFIVWQNETQIVSKSLTIQ
ncbi:MAG: T9SS type A sorting domain-containing protein [Chitinophagaceae bacterium]